MNVGGIRVSNDDIAQSGIAPRIHIESQFALGGYTHRKWNHSRLILKNEYRKLMAANLKEQMCAGTVLEISDATPNQFERRGLQLGKIECKWKLALEPGLDRVSIGRNHIDGIRTRQRRHVQIDEFRKCLLARRVARPHCKPENQEHERRRGHGQPRRRSEGPNRTDLRMKT